jgi:TetR/AcrR family transcriptional regulator, regulator of cefoperazone and chloramphenicol sensitivity
MTDDTKNRLLEAAGQIFSDKGFELATVREICDRAEANVASVNYYFGDKQRLYIDAVRQAQCVCVGQVPMPEWDPAMPATERLRAFVHTMLSRMLYAERPAWHLGLMLRELASPTAACAEVVDDYIRPMAEELEKILADLLPPGTQRSQAYLTGFSIVGQCLFYYVHRPIAELLIGVDEYRQLSIDRLADHIATFSLTALGYAQPATTSASKG